MERRELLTILKTKKDKGFDVFKKEKSAEIILLANEIIAKTKGEKPTTEVLAQADFEILVKVFEKVEEAVKKGFEFETLSELDDNKDELLKKEHDKFFETAQKIIKGGFNLYLYGDKGNGKSYFAKEVAKTENREILVQNMAQTAMDFQGQKDIQGRYSYSLIELAYKNGAVLVLEEMDSYNPNALIYLNSVLEQGYITTLEGEKIERHPNTIVIACGNTDLLTPNMKYSERNTIDLATADRFFRVFMPNFEYLNKKVSGKNYEIINAKIEELHKTKSVRNFVNLNKAIKCGLNLDFSAEALLTE